MEPAYHIWSIRYQGWVSRGGAYTTDLKMAATFGKEEAIKRCKLVFDKHMEEFPLIPVQVTDLDMVKA